MYSKLEFGACYVCSKRGSSEAAKTSRAIRDRVKRADPQWLPKYAQRVRECVEHSQLHGLFPSDAVLIPVPGSSPRIEGALWVPHRIALALRAVGLGASVETPLQRTMAVPKSAFAAPGERPSLDTHYTSFECATSLIQPPHITLVDDVVTKGRTLLAAARRIREAFPNSDVKAFALIRYLGLALDIDSFREPVLGEIRIEDDDTLREP